MVRPTALAAWCRRYLGGVRLILVGAGAAGRHGAVSADRLGRIRAPVPAAPRLELRADPADGGEVPGGDRARGEAREHRDLDGLRRPGRSELRHRQHGAVHARARRRPVARGPQARTAGSSSTSFASGCARSCPSGSSPGWRERLEQGGLSRRRPSGRRSWRASASSRATS